MGLWEFWTAWAPTLASCLCLLVIICLKITRNLCVFRVEIPGRSLCGEVSGVQPAGNGGNSDLRLRLRGGDAVPSGAEKRNENETPAAGGNQRFI